MSTLKINSFAARFIPCLLAGLTGGFTFTRISTRIFNGHFPMLIAIAIGLLFLAFTIIYALVWHTRAKKNPQRYKATPQKWQDPISYFVAFDLSMFGWQKLFHLQFFTPLGKLDMPFSSFTGDELLFTFFGYSFAFVVVIGLIEIVGSLLVVIKRTRMLGLFILFPLLLNILIMDYFYGLQVNVILHALVMCSGVLYLILIHYQKLMDFFFPSGDVPSKQVKSMLPALVVILPLLIMTTYDFPDKDPQLKGKYTVNNLVMNRIPCNVKSEADSLLTIVYLDIGRDCVFEYNNLKRREFGFYAYDAKSNSFSIKWRFPDKNRPRLQGTLSRIAENKLKLDAHIGDQVINCILERAR